MKRVPVTPRSNWVKNVEELGFFFHTLENGTMDPTYWDERIAYEFTEAEIDHIDDTTTLLYRMCLSAVDHVIRKDLFSQLAIPPAFINPIKRSWERQDLDLYGRFDLAFNADGDLKLLEFNADTPTSLFEASIVQWFWLEDYQRNTGSTLDQFNSIHEKLALAFQGIKAKYVDQGSTMYFSCVKDNLEDQGTVDYLRDVAMQQGLNTNFIAIEDIGWNNVTFTDLAENPITTLFKLYPWEWMAREDFGTHLLNESLDLFEPAWKMILSNKGILPILWELYPNHPNLLPSYRDASKLGSTYVKKPLLSREGAGVSIVRPDNTVSSDPGIYGSEGFIYQEYLPMPKFDGMTPVLGSWIVAGRSCGLGIREDNQEITQNTSRFVPHYFK